MCDPRPHPDPLPRGEGKAVVRRSLLCAPYDHHRARNCIGGGERFSLSHRMGEGRGEGHSEHLRI